MLSKILAVTHSKVALAVLGVVLVGGGGSAVAVAATTGHLSTLGVNLASENSNANSSSHAHTIGVEGLLTACSTSTPPATISVTDSAGKSWTFVVSATTKINGDTHTDASQGSSATGAGASSAKGDNSTHADGASSGASSATGAGASSAKGDNSTHADGASSGASSSSGDNSANAGDNSAHTAATLADVCASANIGTRHVQVQATQDGANYDAWKVTLQGSGASNSNGSDSGASSDASGD